MSIVVFTIEIQPFSATSLPATSPANVIKVLEANSVVLRLLDEPKKQNPPLAFCPLRRQVRLSLGMQHTEVSAAAKEDISKI